ncbi:uncharacterized protein LOC105286752 [Ooceraea biroi]|uniref:peptidylprolyl isomerase n=1 Tax=Ooceraea biroi TaxID=2015173 RepID=A0A026VWE2_OOCBI|nr:uncharacterized protein LOC105286752 [Ooceraea biroi]EZA47134.1 hypothetical protein X777_16599 [Ooceraea biroi]
MTNPPLKTFQKMDEIFGRSSADDGKPSTKSPLKTLQKMDELLGIKNTETMGFPTIRLSLMETIKMVKEGPQNPALKSSNWRTPDEAAGSNLLYQVPITVIKGITSNKFTDFDPENLSADALKAEAELLSAELYSLDSSLDDEDSEADESIKGNRFKNQIDKITEKQHGQSKSAVEIKDCPLSSFKGFQLGQFVSTHGIHNKVNVHNYLTKMSESDSIGSYRNIKKQIIEAGVQHEEKPKKGDICIINLFGALSNGTIVDECFNRPIYVGNLDICAGIDIALQTMHVDECARFEIGSVHTFNKYGQRTGLAHNATIWYLVKLVNVKRKSSGKHKDKPAQNAFFPITQTSSSFVLQYFLQNCFISLEKHGKEWFHEINLEAVAVKPLRTLQSIASAEIIMGEYQEAAETINYILEHGGPPDSETKFLNDTIIFFNNHKKDVEATLYKRRRTEEEFWLPRSTWPTNECKIDDGKVIPKSIYREIKKIKRFALYTLRVLEKRELRFSEKVLWILAIGASSFTLGVAVKRFFF